MKRLKTGAAAAAMLALAGAAQASPMVLVDGGLGVLDSVNQLEWTANMNLAGGKMGWDAAVAWIATLNANQYAGHNDWRLPTLDPLEQSGELSQLFITQLGNHYGEGVGTQTGDTPEQIANLALFNHVQEYGYWSGTEYAANTGNAWLFYSYYGNQTKYNKGFELYGVAVRAGDVAADVPEPQSLALVTLALGAGLLATKRRPA